MCMYCDFLLSTKSVCLPLKQSILPSCQVATTLEGKHEATACDDLVAPAWGDDKHMLLPRQLTVSVSTGQWC